MRLWPATLAAMACSCLFAISMVAAQTLAATPAGSTAAPQPMPQVGPHGKKLYYFMVFSNATPGSEEEFNRWYDRIHAPMMIESGDFVWTQRFELSPVQFAGANNPQMPKRQYMVIFAVETDDINKVVADVDRRMRLPRNVSSKTLDYSSLLGITYQALGPQISQKEAQHMLAEETAAGRVPPPDAAGPPGGPPGMPPPAKETSPASKQGK